MHIRTNERLFLSAEEKEAMERVRHLCANIYDEASDNDICDAADSAIDALNDLLELAEEDD